MTNAEVENRRRHIASNGRQGMPITLPGGGTFWSRGWTGCDRCGGSVHAPAELVPFTERRNGVVVTGWRCA